MEGYEPGAYVIQGNVKELRRYLDKGGDPNIKHSITNSTLLIDAITQKYKPPELKIEIVDLILEKIKKKGLYPLVSCSPPMMMGEPEPEPEPEQEEADSPSSTRTISP